MKRSIIYLILRLKPLFAQVDYNINGKLMRNLLKKGQTAGRKSVKWHATNQNEQRISAGVYLYSIEAGGLI